LISAPGEQPHAGCSRFGITISQKVSKRAVVRNRLKRQVRAALQVLMPQLKSGLWVVIILRAAAVQCDYWQFLRELEQLFLDLEVLDGH
jgi:ribonuclease P protein component